VNAFLCVSKHDFMRGFERHVIHSRNPVENESLDLDIWLVEEDLNDWLDEMDEEREADEIWLVSSALIHNVWNMISATLTHPFAFNKHGVMWLPHPSDARFYNDAPHLQAAFGMALAEAYMSSLRPESFSMSFGI